MLLKVLTLLTVKETEKKKKKKKKNQKAFIVLHFIAVLLSGHYLTESIVLK